MAKQNGMRNLEDDILKDIDLDDQTKGEVDLSGAADSPHEEFKIKIGKKLPDEFENAPCGSEDHLCVDPANQYQPDWVQLYIQSTHDHQQNPQIFPGARQYSVVLDTWVDVPPRIVESLRSAVEVHHTKNVTDNQIALGQHSEHKKIKRNRFVWQTMPSA